MYQRKESGRPYQVNPHLFFYLRRGEFVVWDYQNHKQWIVQRDYINALAKLARHESISLSMLSDLVKAGMVSRTPVQDLFWGWDIVSKIYHLASSNVFRGEMKSKQEFVEEYTALCNTLEGQMDESLPDDVECEYTFSESFEELNNASLAYVFKKRKTTREFDGSPLSYKTLGSLLYSSCGEIHQTWKDLEDEGYGPAAKRRSFPSGGGLYPMRYLVLVINVHKIEPGIYEYIPSKNGLKRIKFINIDDVYKELTRCLNSQFFCEGLAAGVFFIPDFAREWIKYPHSRSYRDVFMDIAHCSQNLLLAATAMNVRTWVTAAFQDEDLRRFLGIKDAYSYPAEFIGLGYGENHSLPKAFRKNQPVLLE